MSTPDLAFRSAAEAAAEIAAGRLTSLALVTACLERRTGITPMQQRRRSSKRPSPGSRGLARAWSRSSLQASSRCSPRSRSA
jgi:hypothetical protein